MELTLDVAKNVIEKGIEVGAFDWDPGSSRADDLVIKEATRLMTSVLKLSESGNTNDGVLDLLHITGFEPRSDATREAYAQRFSEKALANGDLPTQASDDSSSFAGGNSHEALPVQSAPAGAFSSPPAADVEPSDNGVESQINAEAAAGEFDINSIYPGYDDQKVADIKKAVLHFASTGELSPDEWEQIKAYEAANEERKTILSLQPEFPAPEPTPVADLPSADQAGVSAFGGGGAPVEQQQSATEFFANGAKEGGDSIQAFYNDETISRAAQEGLPIPPKAPEAPLVMPINITSTSSEELSRLATEYYSRFSRTEWLISQESGRERAAEQLEQDAHRDAYNQAYAHHTSAIPEGKAGPTALDAARKLAEKDADGAQAVQIWRTRKIRHGIDTNELKALARIFEKAMWRINEELERRAREATTAGGTQR